MRANLKFLMQLHDLAAGKGQLGGLARLVHVMQQRVQVVFLRLGEVASFALFNLLAADVVGNFCEQGGGVGEIAGGQPGGDGRIFLAGGNNKAAIGK